jgi:cell division protein FtsB
MIKNALMLFFICAAVLIFFLPSYLKMQALNEKNQAYEKQIAALEKDTTLSEEEQRRLVEDPAYFEKVAREKLGIIKDDEVIYKILPPGQKRTTTSADTTGLFKTTKQSLVDDLDLFPDDPIAPAPKPTVVKKKTTSVAGKTTTTQPKKTSTGTK